MTRLYTNLRLPLPLRLSGIQRLRLSKTERPSRGSFWRQRLQVGDSTMSTGSDATSIIMVHDKLSLRDVQQALFFSTAESLPHESELIGCLGGLGG